MNEKHFAPAGLLLANGVGQDGFQCYFGRAAVVIGNPTRELEDFWRDECLCANDFEDWLQTRMRGFFGEPRNTAEDFSWTKRDLNSSANFDLLGKRGRNGVVE